MTWSQEPRDHSDFGKKPHSCGCVAPSRASPVPEVAPIHQEVLMLSSADALQLERLTTGALMASKLPLKT